VIHLDTCFLVDLMREASRGRIGPATSLLRTLENEVLAISIHVLCELHAGAELSSNPAEEHHKVEALCSGIEVVAPGDTFPRIYGTLLARLERRGERIATMDLLIATAAVVSGASLVTRNARHFERISELRLAAY
jgi:predicted nucleic acid-binding protein